MVLLLSLLLQSCTTARKRAESSEAIGHYHLAAERYQALYRKASPSQRPLRAYLAYRAAECNLRLRHLTKALHQYRQAERYGYTDSCLLARLAYTLHTNGDYEEAKTYYQRFLNYRPQDSLALLGLEGLALAQQSPIDSSYVLQLLEPSLSTASEHIAAISPSGQELYFLSRRGRQDKSKRTGESPSRIYVLRRSPQGEWSGRVEVVQGFLPQGVEYEGIAFSRDGRQLYYVTHTERGEASIAVSTRLARGTWGVGKPLLLPANAPKGIRHLSLNTSATRLYFVAQSDSTWDSDLYYLDLRSESENVVHRLPTSINTRAQELFPYAVGDSTLYFSSDGHPTRGGFDLYRASLHSDGSWAVEHLPAPLNSHKDEIGFVPDTFGGIETKDSSLYSRGILISNRDDSRGRLHLYEYRQSHSTTLLDGFVADQEGYGIGGAMLRLVSKYGEARELEQRSRDDGSFTFEVIPNNHYILLVSKAGYLSQYAELQTVDADKGQSIMIDFKLAKRNIPEVLRHLYYTFDSDQLLDESETTLQELLRLMRDNPTIRIQLSSHTDRIGSDAYNRTLALRRVERVVSWLVERGIEPLRLVAKAYGKERPYVVGRRDAEQYSFLPLGQSLSEEWIERLASPEQRALCDELNRRTEFLVLD